MDRCSASGQSTRIIPLTKWPEFHPWPTVAGMRWLVFNAEKNGFGTVIRRAGRRVLIDERAFFNWVNERTQEAKTSRA